MGNIGEPMDNQTVPTVGSSGTNYARDISLFLEEVKQRLEDDVPFSSVTFVSMDMTNTPLIGAQYVQLYEQLVSPTAPEGSLQNYGGDLWYVSDTGSIQITTNSSLNAAGIGGITGDYGGANPAQLRFVDADKVYHFYDDYAAGTWARLSGGPVRIHEYNTAESVYVEQAVAAGLASSYTVTWPAALSASATNIMRVSSAGAITFTETLEDLYFTNDQRTAIPPSDWFQSSATHTPAHNAWTLAVSANFIWAPIRLPVGAVVHRVRVRADKLTSSGTIGATVRRSLDGTDSAPPEGAVSVSNAANAPGIIEMDSGDLFSGTGFAIDSTYAYHVRLEPTGGATPANDRFFLVEIDWDFPAP